MGRRFALGVERRRVMGRRLTNRGATFIRHSSTIPNGRVLMRADTDDVAFRLLLALGDLWEGLGRSDIDQTRKGLHLSVEYLGGYMRVCAGPGGTPRLIVEWNESSRHLRVLKNESWARFEATVSDTVAHIRQEAGAHGIQDAIDKRLVEACLEPAPVRRTVAASAREPVATRRS